MYTFVGKSVTFSLTGIYVCVERKADLVYNYSKEHEGGRGREGGREKRECGP